MKGFWKLLSRLRHYWWAGIIALVLSFVSAFTEGFSVLLVIPMLEGLGQETQPVTENNRILEFINNLFRNVPEDQILQTAAVVFVGLTLIKTVISITATAVQTWLKSRLDRELREEVFDQILALSYENLNQRRDSDWYIVINSATGKAANALFGVITMLSSLFTILVYVGALLIISWQMTLIAAVLMIAVLGTMSIVVRLAQYIGRRNYNAHLTINHYTAETLEAKQLIRIMHQQDYERTRFRSKLPLLQRTLIYLGIVSVASRQILELLVIGILAAIMVISSSLLNMEQTALIPILTAFILILYRMMPYVLDLNTQRTLIGGNIASVDSVLEVLEDKDATYIPDGTRTFEKLQDKIAFRDVSFRYSQRDGYAVEDMSFEVLQGQTVALVGESGAGKTTTIDLLVRLYDPTQGQILVDGCDLRDLKLADWLQKIGTVSQDTFIFNNTIAFNIQYGSPDATQAEIEQAARHANAHEFISEMPEGYETIVGDRGVMLSGGQRQRIAIARAILRNPELLILDEATSSLDSKNEKLIQTALAHLSQNRTVIVIAHRLSTILNADQIVVMDDGRVVETGTHSALLALGGYYADLFNTQFEGALLELEAQE